MIILFLNAIWHMLPEIMVVVGFFCYAVIIFSMSCLVYIDKVTNAHTSEGVEDLAKHLANQTGGKAIQVDDNWRDFVPAAQGLNELHKSRLDQQLSSQ